MKKLKIEIKKISKVFYTGEMETHALRDISFDIYEGDYISISGPSGCGKSTLLSLLGLLAPPSSGQYLIEGEDVSNLTLTDAATIRNRKIGFVFQQFNLIDELSVIDNVALPLKYQNPPVPLNEARERAIKCLTRVDLGHRVDHKPNQLSGGQQQRVAIARALIAEPAILLVDEPTGNLDSKNGDIVMEMLEQLNKEGVTICMVTHDARYADMAHRQLHLLDGEIVEQKQNVMEAV
ncbi:MULTISPECIES: ABC transporter ATP-binding protein [Pseudoalteromonas]|uniref:ATP-binding cassette domain-containing protein n=1 Tax=Pseudoalteromonas rubra TaxID=43658 RepID=A0A5S3UY61_9GAMM|nr:MULTISPECIES: ABC transporter ATP-binding protein [Pseudoalteromonas]MCG7563687.1 ABC transporter ATP-binding protein [Pseudoalteromonas sp. McH1-42]MEC4090306.1 ABC transporter ATP-binding protein [Pseudoalteromonas rubra]QPB85028.1 ATP-binding cassette domain-containing protein [Pseudoalteromonas rubra]